MNSHDGDDPAKRMWYREVQTDPIWYQMYSAFPSNMQTNNSVKYNVEFGERGPTKPGKWNIPDNETVLKNPIVHRNGDTNGLYLPQIIENADQKIYGARESWGLNRHNYQVNFLGSHPDHRRVEKMQLLQCFDSA